MCMLMKKVKTKTVKSYLYCNIANRNEAMAKVLSAHYRKQCGSSVSMFLICQDK